MNLCNSLPFYSQSYWEEFYKDLSNLTIYDWYFNLSSTKCNLINISNIKKTSEILVIGVGTSSKGFLLYVGIIDDMIKKKLEYVTLLDFSKLLIDHIQDKYSNYNECSEWQCK